VHPRRCRRAAVVGASGFLGGALVDSLRTRGTAVEAVTRQNPLTGPDGRLAPRLTGVDTVFWVAMSVNPASAESAPERAEGDVSALRAGLSLLRSGGTPPRVVLLSSGGTVYDADRRPPYAETDPVRPAGAYGRAKLAQERELARQSGAFDGVAVLRVANAYGPGQRAGRGQGVLAHWLRAALREEPIDLIGDPRTSRDYVYVDDVVAAMVAAAEHAGPLPPAVNVGSGRPTSLEELAAVVCDVVHHPLEVRRLPARSFDVPRNWLAVDLARRELGWSARTSLTDGVRAMWEWTRQTQAGGAQAGRAATAATARPAGAGPSSPRAHR
jgi:UDP-glucose 4-epimerase